MTKITHDMLAAEEACAPGLAWFAKRFPDGATWTELVKAIPDRDWAAWLGRKCPAGVEGATWKARLALQRNDTERAWFGRQCPAGVEGATWDARLALQRSDWDRARLAQYCPAGVDGDPRREAKA